MTPLSTDHHPYSTRFFQRRRHYGRLRFLTRLCCPFNVPTRDVDSTSNHTFISANEDMDIEITITHQRSEILQNFFDTLRQSFNENSTSTSEERRDQIPSSLPQIYQAYEIAATSHQSTLSTGLPASEQTTDVVQRPISQLEKIRPQVLNLSKQTLTQHQIKLLTRGPKFCPTTKDRTRIKDRHTTERSETYVPYPVHQT